MPRGSLVLPMGSVLRWARWARPWFDPEAVTPVGEQKEGGGKEFGGSGVSD
jgi:hypothetical protein